MLGKIKQQNFKRQEKFFNLLLHFGLPLRLSWYRIRLQCGRPGLDPWVGKIRWRRDRLPTPVFLGFPCGSAGTEPACSAGDLGSISGLEDPLEEERLPTAVFWPGEFHGLYSPWDCKVGHDWVTFTQVSKQFSKNISTVNKKIQPL